VLMAVDGGVCHVALLDFLTVAGSRVAPLPRF
jgi:hypothetical protein